MQHIATYHSTIPWKDARNRNEVKAVSQSVSQSVSYSLTHSLTHGCRSSDAHANNRISRGLVCTDKYSVSMFV